MKNGRKPRSRARDSKPSGQLPAGAQTDSPVSPPDKPPVAVSNDGSVLSGAELTTELRANLPTDDTATVERFQTEVERFRELGAFFKKYPDEKEGFEEAFGKSERALEYKRPYDVSIVGITGVGKSALTNCLLGRKLSLSQEGAPVTGTLLRFQHNVPTGGNEEAVVTYRNRNNLFSLIQREFESFGLDSPLKSPDDVKVEVAATLEEIQLPPDANEKQKRIFAPAREALVGVFRLFFKELQHLERIGFQSKFPVSTEPEIEVLNKHLSEVSGVVKEVNYSLKRHSDTESSLELPTNVCLVDLPGEFGQKAHEFVIDDSIPNAGAVIFLTGDRRTGTRGEVDLAEHVRECLNVPGRSYSSKKVFLVLNLNEGSSQENLVEGLKDTLGTLSLEEGDIIQVSLKPKEEQGIPELIDELKTFTRETLLEERIADGQSAINFIVERLKKQYTGSINKLQPHPEREKATKASTEFAERARKAQDFLSVFRRRLDKEAEDFKTALKEAGDSICQEIDERILATVKAEWVPHDVADAELGGPVGKVSQKAVLAAVGAEIWKALPGSLESFAEILAEQYQKKFSNAEVRQKLIEFCDTGSHISKKFFTEEDISEIMGEMREDLVNFSERAGLVFATKVEYSFSVRRVSSDEASSDSDEASSDSDEVSSDSDEVSSDSGIDEEAPKTLEDYVERARQQSSASSKSGGGPGSSASSQNRPTLNDVRDALPRKTQGPEAFLVEEADFEEFVRLARERYQNAVLEETVEAFLNVFRYQWLLVHERLAAHLEYAKLRVTQECATNPALCDFILTPQDDLAKVQEFAAKIRMLEEI